MLVHSWLDRLYQTVCIGFWDISNMRLDAYTGNSVDQKNFRIRNKNGVPAFTRNSSTSKGELDINDFDIFFCLSPNVTIFI